MSNFNFNLNETPTPSNVTYLKPYGIYDNVEITKITQKQESVDGLEPMVMISWQERKTCH